MEVFVWSTSRARRFRRFGSSGPMQAMGADSRTWLLPQPPRPSKSFADLVVGILAFGARTTSHLLLRWHEAGSLFLGGAGSWSAPSHGSATIAGLPKTSRPGHEVVSLGS